MKQYKQRKGKPSYVYKQPEMTPQQRYRWDRGFEQHMGGLIVTDKKTGRRITRSFDPTTYNKARIRRRKRHTKKPVVQDPCNYPSRGRRLGDVACKKVPKGGVDNKHEHNTSKPATVIQLEYDVITYLPPKLETDKTGYTHAGMNIQYTHTGKMYEVLGRDEQLIFRTTIGASIAVLLMMVFLGNITHTLDIVGLGASYTPEGSTIIAYLKDTFRSYSTLPATLRRNAYVLFENLERLITNQQLAPNSLLNTIISQREGIMRRFINVA